MSKVADETPQHAAVQLAGSAYVVDALWVALLNLLSRKRGGNDAHGAEGRSETSGELHVD